MGSLFLLIAATGWRHESEPTGSHVGSLVKFVNRRWRRCRRSESDLFWSAISAWSAVSKAGSAAN